MMDHNPGWIDKRDPDKYTNIVNELVRNLDKYIHLSRALAPTRKIVMGGHSTSGQAAINSFHGLEFTPDAFFGLDPYKVQREMKKITAPVLLWGFNRTTCAVDREKAAKGAYYISPTDKRVFYQVKNTDGKITHCIFTNGGCQSRVCPAQKVGFWVRQAVANSLSPFTNNDVILNDRFLSVIPKEHREDLNLYVNGDVAT